MTRKERSNAKKEYWESYRLITAAKHIIIRRWYDLVEAKEMLKVQYTFIDKYFIYVVFLFQLVKLLLTPLAIILDLPIIRIFRDLFGLFLEDLLSFFYNTIGILFLQYILRRTYLKLSGKRNVSKNSFFEGVSIFLKSFLVRRKRWVYVDRTLSIQERLFRFVLSGPFGYMGYIYNITWVRFLAVVAYWLMKLLVVIYIFFPPKLREEAVLWNINKTNYLEKRFKDQTMHPGYKMEFSTFLYLYLEVAGVHYDLGHQLADTVNHRRLVAYTLAQRKKFNKKKSFIKALADFFARHLWLMRVLSTVFFWIFSFVYMSIYLAYSLVFLSWTLLKMVIEGALLLYLKAWEKKLTFELNVIKRQDWMSILLYVVTFIVAIPSTILVFSEAVYFMSPFLIPGIFFFFYGPGFLTLVFVAFFWLPPLVLGVYFDYWRELWNELKYFIITWTIHVQHHLIMHFNIYHPLAWGFRVEYHTFYICKFYTFTTLGHILKWFFLLGL